MSTQVADRLMDFGAEVDYENKNGQTPLLVHIALSLPPPAASQCISAMSSLMDP
jgi:hypothetical protein